MRSPHLYFGKAAATIISLEKGRKAGDFVPGLYGQSDATELDSEIIAGLQPN